MRSQAFPKPPRPHHLQSPQQGRAPAPLEIRAHATPAAGRALARSLGASDRCQREDIEIYVRDTFALPGWGATCGEAGLWLGERDRRRDGMRGTTFLTGRMRTTFVAVRGPASLARWRWVSGPGL